MSGTHFKFWLHSYYTLSNVWRQRTAARTLQREDKKNSQIKRSVRWTADGRPFRKKDKHAFRSHALKSRSKKRGRKGKKRAQVVVSKSRVPITSAMKKASPLGFDQRLLMKESGRFKYTHIPHGLFKANFEGVRTSEINWSSSSVVVVSRLSRRGSSRGLRFSVGFWIS